MVVRMTHLLDVVGGGADERVAQRPQVPHPAAAHAPLHVGLRLLLLAAVLHVQLQQRGAEGLLAFL